jgi:hypothetical protein
MRSAERLVLREAAIEIRSLGCAIQSGGKPRALQNLPDG